MPPTSCGVGPADGSGRLPELSTPATVLAIPAQLLPAPILAACRRFSLQGFKERGGRWRHWCKRTACMLARYSSYMCCLTVSGPAHTSNQPGWWCATKTLGHRTSPCWAAANSAALSQGTRGGKNQTPPAGARSGYQPTAAMHIRRQPAAVVLVDNKTEARLCAQHAYKAATGTTHICKPSRVAGSHGCLRVRYRLHGLYPTEPQAI